MGQDCIYCHEVVTNPVCPACVELEIKNWLFSKDKTLVKKLPRFYEETTNGVTCILCGKTMDICSYCYTEDVRFWLKEIKPELEEEFLKRFNFGYKRKEIA